MHTHARFVTAVLLAGATAFASASCSSEKYPPKNTSSDLISFSRIDRAWPSTRGGGATVAVVDWQFDPDSAAARRYVHATSLVPGESIGDMKPWHGSWMVDIVHAVAPEATITPINARSLKEKGYQRSLLAGIRWAADHGAVCVTNSMGPVEKSAALTEAIDYAEMRGTLFVDVHPEFVKEPGGKARGCLGAECDPRILRVGVVSVPEHPTRPEDNRDVYVWPYALDETWQDGWGYSVGPPVVGGVIALMKSANPSLTPAQLKALLIESCDERDGFRVVNAEAAVRAAIEAR